MAWRYRVLGIMGLDNHPTKAPVAVDEDEHYIPAYGPGGLGQYTGPALCVTVYPHWRSAPREDNFCRRQLTRIPPPPIISNNCSF